MRILFTSDLHGNRTLYEDLLRHSEKHRPDAVILGGDLFPRYGHHDESLRIQEKFAVEIFRALAGRICDTLGGPLYAIPGNDDWAEVLPLLQTFGSGLIRFLHQGPVQGPKGFRFFGYPWVPPTPFPPKDFEKRDRTGDIPKPTNRNPVISRNGHIEPINELDTLSLRPSIEEDLLTILEEPNPNKHIVVTHSPPHNTCLDRLRNGHPVGSRSIRKFLETRCPLLSLHGHIHESAAVTGKYWDFLGDTLCINPGQTGPRLSAVLFDTDDPFGTLFHTLAGAPVLETVRNPASGGRP